MELGSCHLPVACNFGLVPRFLESLCTPALRSYGLFQHCAPTRWKAATLSVMIRKSVVSSGDVTVPSPTIKKPVYKRRIHLTFVNSFNRSFIHSFTHLLVPQILWQYMGLRLNKKINSNHRHPTRATNTDGNRHTIFWKVPGSVKHDVFTAKRRYITLLSNAQDVRDTVLQCARLEIFNVVWD
jgi:hypothetical protein